MQIKLINWILKIKFELSLYGGNNGLRLRNTGLDSFSHSTEPKKIWD